MNQLFKFAIGVSLLSLPYQGYSASCKTAGPQSPRDITSTAGTNKVQWTKALPYQKMNLCNIHFHRNAEHKGLDFAKLEGKGDEQGYVCKQRSGKKSSPKLETSSCKHLKAGDTIEVHWVYTSCDVKPGEGLGACVSESCANPSLRVEGRVFYLGKDGIDFKELSTNLNKLKLPEKGKMVEYLGSTTGPKYTAEKCSPYQVTWRVDNACQELNIASLDQWCAQNPFNEDHAHGVRKLVKKQSSLSKINK